MIESAVYRRQILPYKDSPCTERVNTDRRSQNAVTAYLKSKQLLPFCFARQNTGDRERWMDGWARYPYPLGKLSAPHSPSRRWIGPSASPRETSATGSKHRFIGWLIR